MKALPLAPVKLLQSSKFYLFTITVGLSALQLILTWRMIGDMDPLIIGVLFWGAILRLLWRKQDTLNLESDIFSSFFGTLLIALVLAKSISLFLFESSFVIVAPIITALGLGLLASGFKGLKQYWRELIIVLLLSLPQSSHLPESSLFQIIEDFFKVTTLTAQVAVFFLWYLGFEVTRQGANVFLPSGSVLVAPYCTGINAAILLSKLSILFILMFPLDWVKKILVLIGSVFIAFATGVIRVALLAIVVSNKESFAYWHGMEGNHIFATMSILIFGLLCRFMLQPEEGVKGRKSSSLQND